MRSGWKRISLESICNEITDGSHFSPKTTPNGYSYITVRDIENDKVDFERCKYISEKDYLQLLKNGCKPNIDDILFSKDGTVGKVAKVDTKRDFVVLSSLAILRPNKELVDSSFLKFILKSPSFLDEAIGKKTGVAIRRIILRNLKSITIPLPPLPEQHRIVKILDQAFEGLATAKANAEMNLLNARALFESYLNSVFTRRGEGWEEKKLGEFSSFENGDRGTNYPSRSARTSSGIPFINAGHLDDERIDFTSMNYISRERFNLLGGGKTRPNDILFCLRGSLGKYASVENLPEGAIASSLIIVRPDESVSNKFILAYFRSNLCVEMIERYKNGAAQPNLSGNSLSKFVVPIPPLNEQRRIIDELDELAAETKHLESIYQQKAEELDALKKSLLHQAFQGEL